MSATGVDGWTWPAENEPAAGGGVNVSDEKKKSTVLVVHSSVIGAKDSNRGGEPQKPKEKRNG